MDRFTISLEQDLADEFDALIRERGYRTRSEAVRDILRSQLQARQRRAPGGYCVATLSYVYNHHEHELAERLAQRQHEHHDLTIATMHAHLDHEQCIESVILKGPSRSVQRFADVLIAERGVRHGQLNLVSVERGRTHRHGGARHRHLKPRH
jgi:CopG family nickel-responsive transcriptional regulator